MVYYDVCKLVCAEESVQVSPQKLHNHRPFSRVVERLETCVCDEEELLDTNKINTFP